MNADDRDFLALSEELVRALTALSDVSAERDRLLAAVRAILAGAPDPISVCEKAMRGRL